MTPTATLTPRGVERTKIGHPWIYRSDVTSVRANAGDVVQVMGPRGRFFGMAFFSDRSQIALRFLTRDQQTVDEAFWRARLARAFAYRESLAIDASAYRVVHGEADLLPSLIVDRYDNYLVLQTLSQGTDRLRDVYARALGDLLSPAGILARNDAKVRTLEGLEMRTETLLGAVPDHVEVREGRIVYHVNLHTGQKTGLFLDQRENREAAARYAHGRLLDCFSYHGGFALALAARCHEVTAIEASEDAAERIRANAARNGLTHVTVRTANVFDELREFDRADERFDTIVLDPPAFAKNRAALPKALAGYKEINLRALRLLSPGGILVTCTCSHHVDEYTFADVLTSAALDAGAQVTIVEKRVQGRDHPVLLGVPETQYLKCFILRKL